MRPKISLDYVPRELSDIKKNIGTTCASLKTIIENSNTYSDVTKAVICNELANLEKYTEELVSVNKKVVCACRDLEEDYQKSIEYIEYLAFRLNGLKQDFDQHISNSFNTVLITKKSIEKNTEKGTKK